MAQDSKPASLQQHSGSLVPDLATAHEDCGSEFRVGPSLGPDLEIEIQKNASIGFEKHRKQRSAAKAQSTADETQSRIALAARSSVPRHR